LLEKKIKIRGIQLCSRSHTSESVMQRINKESVDGIKWLWMVTDPFSGHKVKNIVLRGSHRIKKHD
jgi:hypothetical protein